jgi:putative chitinase
MRFGTEYYGFSRLANFALGSSEDSLPASAVEPPYPATLRLVRDEPNGQCLAEILERQTEGATAMTVNVTLAQILQLAPKAQAVYREAFDAGQPVLDRFGISETPLRVAHFLAQIMHESGGLTVQFENLNYRAERLAQVWPSRFRPTGPLDPNEFAQNPSKLANEVYGRRMGNSEPDDGFKYRGRGLLQLTGKSSYLEATSILRKQDPEAPDFVLMPDEVISPRWCLAIAASEWAERGCNAMADADDIQKITRRINGGLIGLNDRIKWAERTKAIWH